MSVVEAEEMSKNGHTFVQFPVEVVESITKYIRASDLCRLWISGDSRLNRKLEARGVREIVVEFSPKVEVPRWSFKLLRRFSHLRSMRIISPGKSIVHFDTHILDTLPKEIEVLEIVSPQALSIWTIMLSPREGFESFSNYPIGSKFPLLQRLRLTASLEYPKASTIQWGGPQFDALSQDIISILPGGLREFETSSPNLGITSIGKLPRKLTTLVLHKELTESLYLPKTITKLAVNNLWGECKWLPATLKSCMIGNKYFDRKHFAALPPYLLQLYLPNVTAPPPPIVNLAALGRLHTLDLGSLKSHDDPIPLPTSLTALKLNNWNLNAAFFSWIPPTIVRLHVGCEQANLEENPISDLLPTTLKHLTIDSCSDITKEQVELLPVKLSVFRSLSFCRLDGVVFETTSLEYVEPVFWPY